MKLLDSRSPLKLSQPSNQTRVYSHGTNDQPTKRSKMRAGDFQLTSVNDETSTLQKSLNHVLMQIGEAERLRQVKESFLDPDEKRWVKKTIEDASDAARDMALLLEPTRVQKETGRGRLSIGSQLWWKYRDSPRAKDKSDRMMTCHASLMNILSHLQRIETTNNPTCHELGADDPLKGKGSLYSIQPFSRLDVGSNGGFEEEIEAEPLEIRSQKMNDLLAWRRSKGTLKNTTEKLELADCTYTG